jgi:ribose/xylose/arabinose/galactoside ABC-type transport system permease subunit
MVMAFNGLMCGIAGVMGVAYLGAADPQSGTGYELSAIAAAIVGGAQLGGGSGTVWGSLIGIALIMTIQNGLVLLGLRPAWQIASTGLIIIAAVTIDYFLRARRASLSATVTGLG